MERVIFRIDIRFSCFKEILISSIVIGFLSVVLLACPQTSFAQDGNLYVTSSGGNEVLRYARSTGAFIDKFVRAGIGGLNTPQDLTFGPDGNLYVTSLATNEVLRYAGSTGAFIDAFV